MRGGRLACGMGGKNNKPVRNVGGGGPPVDAEQTEKPFHSKEWEQAQLNELMNPAKERPSWDEWKETLRKKGEADGGEEQLQQQAQARFREELDRERNAKLVARGGGDPEAEHKKSHKHKHKESKKEKKHKKEKRKKKKRRRDSDSSSSDDDSDSREHKSKKSKKEKKSKGKKKSDIATNADGAVSLRSFFAAENSSDSD